MYTTSTAFLDALVEGGVSYLFANFGSDHPAILESLAEARATGRPAPKVVTCPNEMVALSAAQGYAQVTGRAQAVLVHVDCGTQSLGGALHNVARGRDSACATSGFAASARFGIYADHNHAISSRGDLTGGLIIALVDDQGRQVLDVLQAIRIDVSPIVNYQN